MDQFPPNSAKSKAAGPTPRVAPVASARQVRRKRSLGRTFIGVFFSGDPKQAFHLAIEDVVVPALRDTLFEALSTGLDQVINGKFESRASRRVPANQQTGPGRTNYASYSDPKPAPAVQRTMSREARVRHDFDEIVFDSRIGASDVLSRLYDILARNEQVTVADLYALSNLRSDHTDFRWGWTNLEGAGVRGRSGHFFLDLPRPTALSA